MDKKFADFLNTYLDEEQAYDNSGYLRPTLMGCNESHIRVIRDGFTEIIRDENFGTAEYEHLTNIEFPDYNSLQQYLLSMYSYLFENTPNQPIPPRIIEIAEPQPLSLLIRDSTAEPWSMQR